jgi:hypothetical protein
VFGEVVEIANVGATNGLPFLLSEFEPPLLKSLSLVWNPKRVLCEITANRSHVAGRELEHAILVFLSLVLTEMVICKQ